MTIIARAKSEWVEEEYNTVFQNKLKFFCRNYLAVMGTMLGSVVLFSNKQQIRICHNHLQLGASQHSLGPKLLFSLPNCTLFNSNLVLVQVLKPKQSKKTHFQYLKLFLWDFEKFVKTIINTCQSQSHKKYSTDLGSLIGNFDCEYFKVWKFSNFLAKLWFYVKSILADFRG